MNASTARRLRAPVRRTQVVLLAFGALSAVGGGVAMLFTNGLGMPQSMLDGSPFTSFVVPAFVLLIVVGGTQTLALVLELRRVPSAPIWSAVAGFGMTIWIVVETVIIQGFSALQAVYLALGILELALVIGALWLDVLQVHRQAGQQQQPQY